MKKIDSLNDVKKPDESIILLDKITRDPKQSAFDKYYAYVLKARTYKRLYNHTEALNNLDRAMLEGKKSNKAAEVESQVLMENCSSILTSSRSRNSKSCFPGLQLKSFSI